MKNSVLAIHQSASKILIFICKKSEKQKYKEGHEILNYPNDKIQYSRQIIKIGIS